MKKAIVLIGMMGAGKSSVGRELARMLGLPCCDLDEALARRHGSIPAQFKRDGEAAFRRREAVMLRRLGRPGALLSTGGGVVLDAGNRRWLRRQLCVYLEAPPKALFKRLRGAQARRRPLLQGQDLGPRLARLSRERGPFYRACATFRVRASQGTPRQVAGRIARRLKAFSIS